MTTAPSSDPPAQAASAATAPPLLDHVVVAREASQAPASSASSVAQPPSARRRHRPTDTMDTTSTDGTGASGSQPDWEPKVDVVVFCFLDLASNYEPPDSLAEWLEVGEQPVYIGFDSLSIPLNCVVKPLEEPEKMTNIILQALEITGQRGVINRGWGGLERSDSVYLVDNCPHDWLFQRCSAVVHHGGAGTTAASLKAAVTDTAIFRKGLLSQNVLKVYETIRLHP
ncbi:hypothetical protein L3X38_031436 [Prunus dulcis]|uniref:UDP-Glycosyltransferase superfamily protein n=1 Tax=Prunus dulcis TaxID=3755 RepID=A0AAD4VC37_PRUDU|nr:hypothetical protein L3X38_031436 [Prunus dulcis]